MIKCYSMNQDSNKMQAFYKLNSLHFHPQHHLLELFRQYNQKRIKRDLTSLQFIVHLETTNRLLLFYYFMLNYPLLIHSLQISFNTLDQLVHNIMFNTVPFEGIYFIVEQYMIFIPIGNNRLRLNIVSL